MRAIIGGVLAAFVYFHSPDGGIVAVKEADGQLIVRPSPPGYACCTMIQSGAGTAIVRESPCAVAHALELSCPMTRKPQ